MVLLLVFVRCHFQILLLRSLPIGKLALMRLALHRATTTPFVSMLGFNSCNSNHRRKKDEFLWIWDIVLSSASILDWICDSGHGWCWPKFCVEYSIPPFPFNKFNQSIWTLPHLRCRNYTIFWRFRSETVSFNAKLRIGDTDITVFTVYATQSFMMFHVRSAGLHQSFGPCNVHGTSSCFKSGGEILDDSIVGN